MNRKEAMEWAKKAGMGFTIDKTADLFQEATKGRFLLGERVEMKGQIFDEWHSGVVVAQGPHWDTTLSENVRPIREKREATGRELIDLLKIAGVTGTASFTMPTLQAMARDLGIETEVEVDE